MEDQSPKGSGVSGAVAVEVSASRGKHDSAMGCCAKTALGSRGRGRASAGSMSECNGKPIPLDKERASVCNGAWAPTEAVRGPGGGRAQTEVETSWTCKDARPPREVRGLTG